MIANDLSMRSKVATLLKQTGALVSITSSTGGNIKTYAVFVQNKQASDTTNSTSLFTSMTVGTTTAYITAIKNPPLPGDTLTGKGRSYRILAVEAYKPSETVIAYKIGLE